MARPRRSTPPITITTTPEQAREFVDKFTRYARFRARFQRDPRTVLAEYGVHVPPELIPKKVVLPRKAEIEALREELADALAEDFSFIWAIPFFSFIGIRAGSFKDFGKGR